MTKKSEKEGAADLLAAFMWLDAVQLDEGNVSLTHTQIANGYATATNGSITCGHPVQFAYECAPLTKPMLAALRKAKSNLSIVRDGQNLSVNSGRLCVSVPCLEAYDIFVVPPDQQKVALTNPQDLLNGLELCAPIATAALKLIPQLAGVLFDNETIASCDGKVAIQYAHSENNSLPNLIIPIQAIKLVIKHKGLTGLGWSDRSVTFWFEDKWIRTNIMETKFPDLNKMLEVECDLFAFGSEEKDGFEAVLPHCEGFIYLTPKGFQSELQAPRAFYKMELKLNRVIALNTKGINQILKNITCVNYDVSGKALFYGDSFRGAIAHGTI